MNEGAGAAVAWRAAPVSLGTQWRPRARAFSAPSRTERSEQGARPSPEATASRSQAGFDVDRDDRLGANEATAEVGPALGAGGEAADELLGVAAGRRRAVARVGVDALAVREAQDDLERGSGVDLDLRVAHGLDDRGRDRDGLGRDRGGGLGDRLMELDDRRRLGDDACLLDED